MPLSVLFVPLILCHFGHAFHQEGGGGGGWNRHIGLVVKVSALRGGDLVFDFHLSPGHFSGLTHSSDLNWHSNGYPARCLALQGQLWDWLVLCQYTVTGWGRKFRGFLTRMVYLKHDVQWRYTSLVGNPRFDLQLLYHCDSI